MNNEEIRNKMKALNNALLEERRANLSKFGHYHEFPALFGSINQCAPFLDYFITFAKLKFDDEAIKAKLDEIVNDFWQFELFD